MSVVYHIRRRLPRAGGNSFYRNRAIRYAGTFCGGAPTSFDGDWRSKAEPCDGRVACSECVRIRIEEAAGVGQSVTAR